MHGTESWTGLEVPMHNPHLDHAARMIPAAEYWMCKKLLLLQETFTCQRDLLAGNADHLLFIFKLVLE